MTPMVQIGKVYRNLMVDVSTTSNAKLVDRGTRIVQTITGRSREASRALLETAGGHVKTALVMHARRVDLSTAGQLLREVDGHVGCLIETQDRND